MEQLLEGERKSPSANEDVDGILEKVCKAQEAFSSYSQERVDKIFRELATTACKHKIPLAKMAVEETEMGLVEDKIIKNQFAAEYIYHQYQEVRTCGVLSEDFSFGICEIADPIGIIAGIIPTTNPTSTTIFKSLLAMKTRNAIVFSPHPRAKSCTLETAKLMLKAAVEAGAPENIIACIERPSIDTTNYLMRHPKINMILATGGPEMVKAAYSSGKPAIGVGPGNVPSVIDEYASVKMAVNSIILSKTFDNGLICASEQSLMVASEIYQKIKEEFLIRGVHFLSEDEKEKVKNVIFRDASLNPRAVGQTAFRIAEMGGVKVPKNTKILIAEVDSFDLKEEPFASEKLSPILAMYRVKDYFEGVEIASCILKQSGLGHTTVYYTDPHKCQERIEYFGRRLKTARVLINMPSSQGAIGDIYNFKLAPSLTLGCGTWGGNSISENVGVKHLMNIKTIASRRENMLWFKVPQKVYFKFGCLEPALKELNQCKRAFIVTDKPLWDLGIPLKVIKILSDMGISSKSFYEVKPDPTIETVNEGVSEMEIFQPDLIVAIGGGSPMDAAKMMWLAYEHPHMEFMDLALKFMDIRKRIYKFPKMGLKSSLIAIPTTSGTGSEVTPFAVITDEKTGIKYPIADYELTPNMAIVDPELTLSMPKPLIAFGGIDALVHALEAYVSVLSSDYTSGLALESISLVFEYLAKSYKGDGFRAKEKMHYAATIAGMAFANAFLGVCHSMAHKLGSLFHIPHGLSNALLISQVIRYNASEVPTKQTAFPQHEYPNSKERYAEVSDRLHLGGETPDEKVESLIEAIEELKREINIPKSIQEAGISEEKFLQHLDEMSEQAFDDQCSTANPRYPLIEEIKGLYIDAFYGKK